jgi:hypothetical protein
MFNAADQKKIKELVDELNAMTSLSERGKFEVLRDFIDIVTTRTNGDRKLASGICTAMVIYSRLIQDDRGRVTIDKVLNYIEEGILMYKLSAGMQIALERN